MAAEWMFLYNSNSEQVPEIVPVGNNAPNNQQPSSNQIKGVVDVVGSYLWTNSKSINAGGRKEVPTIILKEREMQLNAMIAQAAYSIGTIIDSSSKILNSISPNASSSSKNFISSILSKSQSLSALSQSDNLTNAFLSKAADQLGDDPDFLKKPWLQPYKGLYLTQPTPWTYFLPFFQSEYQTTNSSWGADNSSSGGSLLQGITDLSKVGAELVGKFESLLKPGSFQEKSKFYQFSPDGDSITVSFPLINTSSATFEDVIRNWQFIFMLIYQNRPERIDRNLIKPPKMYEVSIPGVRYIPYAYISNIKVEYKGSRRQMVIPIPYIDPEVSSNQETFNVDTIIPEAYQVTLSITGLVADSKNFMYSSINNWQQIVVSSTNKNLA